MPFIPEYLQEYKRQAENALAELTLTNPEQAAKISLYWGKLELELLNRNNGD